MPVRTMLLHRITVVREFLNVVHQAIQLPLSVDLGFAAQRKTIQSFVAAQISEHGFHGGEATSDHVATRVGSSSRS